MPVLAGMVPFNVVMPDIHHAHGPRHQGASTSPTSVRPEMALLMDACGLPTDPGARHARRAVGQPCCSTSITRSTRCPTCRCAPVDGPRLPARAGRIAARGPGRPGRRRHPARLAAVPPSWLPDCWNCPTRCSACRRRHAAMDASCALVDVGRPQRPHRPRSTTCAARSCVWAASTACPPAQRGHVPPDRHHHRATRPAVADAQCRDVLNALPPTPALAMAQPRTT